MVIVIRTYEIHGDRLEKKWGRGEKLSQLNLMISKYKRGGKDRRFWVRHLEKGMWKVTDTSWMRYICELVPHASNFRRPEKNMVPS